MYRQKNNDRTLLLLGGLAAAAALLYMNKSSSESSILGGSSGAGSDLGMYGGGAPTYSTTDEGSSAPIIYQIPGEGSVTFPQGGGLDLGSLLSLLGGNGQVQQQENVTKKQAAVSSAALDVGQTYVDPDTGEQTVMKKPFMSSAQKSSVPITLETPGVLDSLQGLILPAATSILPGSQAVVGGMLGGFSLASLLGLGSGVDATSKKAASAAATQQNPIGNGINNPGGSPVNAAMGLSGQYVRDPATGLLAWNANNNLAASSELGGFGLSRDPKSGEVVAYQRDVSIYGPQGQLYNPSTKSGNPQIVADAQQGTFTSSNPDLTKKEQAASAALMGISSALPAPFVTANAPAASAAPGGSGGNTTLQAGTTKKESATSGGDILSGLGAAVGTGVSVTRSAFEGWVRPTLSMINLGGTSGSLTQHTTGFNIGSASSYSTTKKSSGGSGAGGR